MTEEQVPVEPTTIEDDDGTPDGDVQKGEGILRAQVEAAKAQEGETTEEEPDGVPEAD